MKTLALKQILTATTASLTLCFAASALAAGKDAAGAMTLSAVMQDSQTENSKRMSAWMQKINAEKPTGTPHVVILDPDHIAAWQLLSGGGELRKMRLVVDEYVRARAGKTLDPVVLELIADSVTERSAETASPFAMKPNLSSTAMEHELCAVSPYHPDRAASNYFADVMMKTTIDGKTLDGLKNYTADFGLSTEDFKKLIDAHEVFHCFDNKYYARKQGAKTVQEWTVASNQVEMFADIAGLALRIKEGADVSLIEKIAASRVIRFNLFDTQRAKVYTQQQREFYEITKYYTHPGITLLGEYVAKVGITNIRKLSYEQIRDLAQELTDKADFTWQKTLLLTNYAIHGAANIDAIVKVVSSSATAEHDRKFLTGATAEFAAATKKYLKPKTKIATPAPPDEDRIKDAALLAIVQKARATTPTLTPKSLFAARNVLIDQFRGALDGNEKAAETETMLQFLESGILMATPAVIANPPAFFSK